MLSELAFAHIRCCLSTIPSDLMKSTAVDESLSSMNQQFCSRENLLLQLLKLYYPKWEMLSYLITIRKLVLLLISTWIQSGKENRQQQLSHPTYHFRMKSQVHIKDLIVSPMVRQGLHNLPPGKTFGRYGKYINCPQMTLTD